MSEYVENRDGGFWIAGKRISLDSVVYAYRRGQSAESIQHSFPLLTLEEIYGAIAFYLANQQIVDKSILEDEIEFAKMQTSFRESNSAWHESMNKARLELLLEQK